MSSKATTNKFHFIANPADQKSAELQQRMMDQYGQANLKSADIICAIGGDGSLLYALRDAFNKSVIGQCRTDSNSVGFWMNRVDADNADLENLINTAQRYILHPLKVEITHSDGSVATRYAFTDAVLASNNGQASLCHVFDKAVDDAAWRVMGNGITFATAFGSTAKSYAEGGSALDLTLDAFIMTGSGVCSPLNFKSFIYPGAAEIDVKTDISRHKRDQRIDLDGQTYKAPKGTSVTAFTVSLDKEKQAVLLLDRPARSAFRKLTHDV